MAKLAAHGAEIGRLYYTTSAKAYMADGTVLKNAGFGWKISARVKSGFSPQQVFESARESQIKHNAERPALVAYRKCLHDLAGLSKRWKLHTAVEMMPDDPDGVWSEACDGYGDNVAADIDEVAELCALYKVACAEQRQLKETA